MLRVFFAIAALSGGAAPQPRGGTVSGIVVNKSTRAPVRGAEVIHAADSRIAQSDSAGRFSLEGLPAGTIRLLVRATGFPVATFEVAIAAGERLEPVFYLDSTAAGKAEAQVLPRVAVTAPPSMGPRYADFERRLKTGRGQYLTRVQIERAGYTSLQSAVRQMRGVNVECGGGLGCFIRMARAPMRCLPDYIVDERLDNSFGPNTPIRDIEALEVYTGPSDVPGEFAGRTAGCGVIVIWTRSGPPRRRS